MLNKILHGAERHRGYWYRVGTAVAAVAVCYGVVDGNEAVVILGALAAALGVPASANTTVKKDA